MNEDPPRVASVWTRPGGRPGPGDARPSGTGWRPPAAALAAALLGLCALLWTGVVPSWADPLLVLYPERPPYNHTVDGKPAGFLYERAATVFAEAGVEVQFSEMPSKRILMEIQKGEGTRCTFGWFKTPEREAMAFFTPAFHRDSPLVGLALKRNRGLVSGADTLDALMRNPEVTLGLVLGWSYGETVDGLVRTMGERIVSAPARLPQAVMLARGRFTLTLVREGEVEEVIRLGEGDPEDYLVIPLADLGRRRDRFIMCDRGVAPDILARLNAAAARLGIGGNESAGP